MQLALVLVLILGVYLLWSQTAPKREALNDAQQLQFLDQHPPSAQDLLVIPKIGVSAPIATGDWPVLDQGKVWHRWPERGNPADGGNTILAAHRYVFSWNPRRVVEQSVLYNIDKLSMGDSLYIDYQGKRYSYRVIDKKTVVPDDSAIENMTKDARVTLYSCTLKGDRDGREVIIAEPIRL